MTTTETRDEMTERHEENLAWYAPAADPQGPSALRCPGLTANGGPVTAFPPMGDGANDDPLLPSVLFGPGCDESTEGGSRMGEDAAYRALFEQAADAVLVADDAGVYLDANPAAARMFGVDRDELIGRRVTDFVLEDPAELDQRWSTFVGTEGESGRVRVRRGDGRIIVCDYNVTTNFVAGRHLSILRDVTEVIEARQQRERSELRFHRMLDALDLFALVTDSEGRVMFMNQAMLSSLGVELDQVVGHRLALAQPDGERQHQAFLAAVAAEEITPEWENGIVLPDGSISLVRWSSAFVRDEHGQIEAVASIGEDVTIRRHLEEQMRHAVRMESVGRLACGTAHDFNNFLTVVSGHAELLAGARELSEASRAHIAQITSGIDRASHLTRQLLSYGRQQVMEPCDVSAGEVLQRLCSMLAPMLGASLETETHFDIDADVVFIDPAQFEQVLLNLAVNARDAMPSGGLLRFELTNSDIDDLASEMLGVDTGRYVTIRVSDTGTGIEPDLMTRVFEPFVTTKPVGEGTGLGLASAFGIIAQSNGAITVESEVGRGTTFTIHLPARNTVEATAHTTAPPNTTTNPDQIKGPVVVVDDDHQLLTFIDAELRRAGYDVETFECPLEALETILQRAPTLVLTDIRIREMDGFELARRVRTARPDVPVLVMTGLNTEAANLSRPESFDVLAKPFTIEGLLQRVAASIEHP